MLHLDQAIQSNEYFAEHELMSACFKYCFFKII